MRNYELCKRLGRGGFGVVYLAQETETGVCFAVKKLIKASDPDARRRFKREVRAMQRFAHPHIMRVIEADVSGREPSYVMPWMSGGTLTARARTLSLREVRRVAFGLAEAVAHIHSHEAIHRDIKPDNVPFDSQGHFVLGDFGLANGAAVTARVTATAAGTPGYMAPELAYRTGGASAASDVYSLGATLFHAITGVNPPHLPVLPLDPAKYRADVPADLRMWVIFMTDMNPYQRPTAAAFAAAMKASLVRSEVSRIANVASKAPAHEPRGASDGFSGMLSAALGIGAVALVANALLK